MQRKARWLSLVITLVVITTFIWMLFPIERRLAPVSVTPSGEEAPLVTTVAQGLEIPWALAFLPDGGIIFTERAGRIRLIDPSQGLLAEPLLTISDVAHRGEAGLLGIAVPPDFAQQPYIFVYYTYQREAGLENRVVRYRKEGRTLRDRQIIIDGIPGALNHNGGRIKFGPDGRLYITTGDAQEADLAQDADFLSGKILRLNPDGTIPADNPFPGSPVYSLGHRNPQGIAWDDQGRLWETEHGSSATDEVNLIEPGKNYGWPVIRGDVQSPGLVSPVLHSGSETWAPSGLAFYDGSLYFAGLRGQSLYQLPLASPKTLNRYLENRFGRLRDVAIGSDGFIYLLTSNRDGRGSPTSDDDRILRINPQKLLAEQP